MKKYDVLILCLFNYNLSKSLTTAETVQLEYAIEVKNKQFYDLFTGLMDKIVSLVGLVVAVPILIIVALAIKIEDNGPVFYKQERLGKNGRVFWIYKLRSMRIDAEANGAQWAQAEDDRITRVGKFIRKTRLDEIPQLYNILSGHMKLIGPRPERPELAEEFYEEIPEFVNRLLIKPGLTGWAQVNGGYDITPKEKLEFDIEYIEKRGLVLDLKIILKTIAIVFTGDGAR